MGIYTYIIIYLFSCLAVDKLFRSGYLDYCNKVYYIVMVLISPLLIITIAIYQIIVLANGGYYKR